MCTLIIHGTFDREGEWWRIPSPGDFIETLIQGMEAAGRRSDVWTLGGRHVSTYPELMETDEFNFFSGRQAAPFQQIDGCFRWTGGDYHGIGRIDGGEDLARYLETLANLESGEPINLVAHSHGCNVVKVAAQHISSRVRLGAVVFLAGPHFTEAGRSDAYPYRLNPACFHQSGGGSAPVLNLFDPGDLVQKGLSDSLADLAMPPGLPKASWLGFEGTPVVDAKRVDTDPAARHLYEDLEVSQAVGGGILSGIKKHGAVHGAGIGRLAGLWLGRWPSSSGRDCCRELGIPVV